MGRREARKQEILHSIIKASKKIFAEKGYKETKTSSIAREAGIAEGTVFNYFKTKAEILVAVIGEYFIIDDYDFSYNLTTQQQINTEARRAISYYLSSITYVDKEFLKVLCSTVVLKGKSSKEIYNILQAIDNRVLNSFRDFLEYYYPDKSSTDMDIIMRILYSGFTLALGEYVLSDNILVVDLAQEVFKCLEFVLKS